MYVLNYFYCLNRFKTVLIKYVHFALQNIKILRILLKGKLNKNAVY